MDNINNTNKTLKTLDEFKQQLKTQQNLHFEIEILLRRTVHLFEQSKKTIYLLKQAIKQAKHEIRKAQQQARRQARKIARENKHAAKSSFKQSVRLSRGLPDRVSNQRLTR